MRPIIDAVKLRAAIGATIAFIAARATKTIAEGVDTLSALFQRTSEKWADRIVFRD